MRKLRLRTVEWLLVHECQKQELYWGLFITSLLSFLLPTLIKPIHAIPRELSSMLPPTLSFPSYNLEVKWGEGVVLWAWRSCENTALSSKTSQCQRASNLLLGQCQSRMLIPQCICSLLASTEKSAVLLGNIRIASLESFPVKVIQL